MQVSYGKLTVNDGKEIGGTTSHNRTLSARHVALQSARLETAYFGGWKKFFTLWPAYKSLPQLLGQDFVVNFATYTRVYTVLEKWTLHYSKEDKNKITVKPKSITRRW